MRANVQVNKRKYLEKYFSFYMKRKRILKKEGTMERETPAALDIELRSFQVFHSCMDGAAPYNNLWIERKHRMVRTKQISSLHAGYLLEYQGKDLEDHRLITDGIRRFREESESGRI